jgi:hypothetical protein
MTSLDPVTERARFLYAALALRVFTVKDLADYSGVNLSTVQTYLRRDSQWFEEVDVLRSGRRGGSYKRYRLMEGAREQLKTLGAHLAVELPAGRLAPMVSYSEASEAEIARFDTAFAAASISLARYAQSDEPQRKQKLLELARYQLLDAKDALTQQQSEPREDAYTTLARRYEELSGKPLSDVDTGATRSVYQKVWPEDLPSADSVRNIRSWFTDWTGRIVGNRSPGALGPDPAESVERALRVELNTSSGWTESDTLLAPAARLFELVDPQPNAVRAQLSREVSRQLKLSVDRSDTIGLCQLAVMASLLDLERAASLLFEKLKNSNASSALSRVGRRTLTIALARLAGPNAIAHEPAAGMYAQSLLTHPDSTTIDMAVLTPAALRSKMVDAPQVLQMFASRVYGQRTAELEIEWRQLESTIMRNLTIALLESHFAPLVLKWESLLGSSYGVDFISALTDPKSGNVALRRENEGSDFALLVTHDSALGDTTIRLPTTHDSADGRMLGRLIDTRPRLRRSAPFMGPLVAKGVARLEQEQRRRGLPITPHAVV